MSNLIPFTEVFIAAEQSHEGLLHILCVCAALSPMPASLQ